jgi:hypothetical protein
MCISLDQSKAAFVKTNIHQNDIDGYIQEGGGICVWVDVIVHETGLKDHSFCLMPFGTGRD